MKRSTKRTILSKIHSPFFKGTVLIYHSVSDAQEGPLFTSGIHDISTELSLVDFGNDIENHFMMSSLDREKQFQEIENTQIYLRTLGSFLSTSFAIPFGNQGSYNNHTLAATNQLGYKTFFLHRLTG
ncbi:MAG: peptidoglycan/xylan/chitin deacetylase (PgdA/CDA1 family) [Roseivirga sp.]